MIQATLPLRVSTDCTIAYQRCSVCSLYWGILVLGNVTITKYEGYVEYSFRGLFDDEGVIKAFQDLWAANEYELDRNKLYDLTDTDFKQITSAATNDVMNLRKRAIEDTHFPVAVLAKDDLNFGLSRMIATLSEELTPNVRVFRDRDEAIAWISSEGAHPS